MQSLEVIDFIEQNIVTTARNEIIEKNFFHIYILAISRLTAHYCYAEESYVYKYIC